MGSETVISILVSVVAILSACVGSVTFFLIRRKIWIEVSAQAGKETAENVKIEAEKVTLKRTENINIIMGNVFNVYHNLPAETKAKEGQKRIRLKGKARSIITGAPIVLQSEHEGLIDSVTRFDVYHSEEHKEDIDRLAEKASEWLGFYLLKEPEPQKLREQANG